MIYKLLNDHIKYHIWLLNNIYINFGEKIVNETDIVNEIDIKYKENFLYRANIPDFIIGNEIYFKNHESNNYKTFISNKIEHFFSNEFEYNIVPACIIWFKLSKLFSTYSLMIMYNRCLDAIQYFPHDICYNNYKYIKETPENKIIENEDTVYSSCLFDIYESLQLNNFLTTYIKKILGMKNYKLLNSELDMLDTYNLNDLKYDNLKYLVFRTGISQWQLVDKSDMIDFSKLFDFTTPPNYKSIKFSLFMAWLIAQKILNKPVIKLNYIENTTLNINKLYNYFIFLINDDTGLFIRLIKWLDELDWDGYEETTVSGGSDTLKLLDSFDVNTIFNESNQLYKAYYDYPTNPKIKIKDVIESEYVIENQIESIESSVYDNLDIEINSDEDNNDNINGESNEKLNNNNNEYNLSGGCDLNIDIIGITELSNDVGKIISTVPICKISNIIQWIISKG
jgi:hypothetical protein